MKLSDCGAMMSRCAESSVLVPVSGVPESAVAGSAVAESVVGGAVLNSVVSVVPVIVAPSAGDPEGIGSVDAVSVVDVADSVKTSFSGLVAGVMWVSLVGELPVSATGAGSAGVVSAGVVVASVGVPSSPAPTLPPSSVPVGGVPVSVVLVPLPTGVPSAPDVLPSVPVSSVPVSSVPASPPSSDA